MMHNAWRDAQTDDQGPSLAPPPTMRAQPGRVRNISAQGLPPAAAVSHTDGYLAPAPAEAAKADIPSMPAVPPAGLTISVDDGQTLAPLAAPAPTDAALDAAVNPNIYWNSRAGASKGRISFSNMDGSRRFRTQPVNAAEVGRAFSGRKESVISSSSGFSGEVAEEDKGSTLMTQRTVIHH